MSKKLDAIFSNTLTSVLEELNKIPVYKDDIVTIFQSTEGNTKGQFIAIFYS